MLLSYFRRKIHKEIEEDRLNEYALCATYKSVFCRHGAVQSGVS